MDAFSFKETKEKNINRIIIRLQNVIYNIKELKSNYALPTPEKDSDMIAKLTRKSPDSLTDSLSSPKHYDNDGYQIFENPSLFKAQQTLKKADFDFDETHLLVDLSETEVIKLLDTQDTVNNKNTEKEYLHFEQVIEYKEFKNFSASTKIRIWKSILLHLATDGNLKEKVRTSFNTFINKLEQINLAKFKLIVSLHSELNNICQSDFFDISSIYDKIANFDSLPDSAKFYVWKQRLLNPYLLVHEKNSLITKIDDYIEQHDNLTEGLLIEFINFQYLLIKNSAQPCFDFNQIKDKIKSLGPVFETKIWDKIGRANPILSCFVNSTPVYGNSF